MNTIHSVNLNLLGTVQGIVERVVKKRSSGVLKIALCLGCMLGFRTTATVWAAERVGVALYTSSSIVQTFFEHPTDRNLFVLFCAASWGYVRPSDLRILLAELNKPLRAMVQKYDYWMTNHDIVLHCISEMTCGGGTQFQTYRNGDACKVIYCEIIGNGPPYREHIVQAREEYRQQAIQWLEAWTQAIPCVSIDDCLASVLKEPNYPQICELFLLARAGYLCKEDFSEFLSFLKDDDAVVLTRSSEADVWQPYEASSTMNITLTRHQLIAECVGMIDEPLPDILKSTYPRVRIPASEQVGPTPCLFLSTNPVSDEQRKTLIHVLEVLIEDFTSHPNSPQRIGKIIN